MKSMSSEGRTTVEIRCHPIGVDLRKVRTQTPKPISSILMGLKKFKLRTERLATDIGTTFFDG